MAFSRARREFHIDQEVRRKSNLPGPQHYNPKQQCWNERGFRYHDLTASTIVDECESMNRSKDDLDLPQHSTPLKRPGQPFGSRRKSRQLSFRKPTFDQSKVHKMEDDIQLKDTRVLELEEDIDKLRETLQRATQLKDELQSLYEAEKKENSKLKETIKALEIQLSEKEALYESLKKEFEEQKDLDHTKLVAHGDKELELLKQIEVEQEKKKTLEEDVNDKQKQIDAKSVLLQTAELKVLNLHEQEKELLAQLNKTREELESQKISNKQLQALLKEKEATCTNLQKDLQEVNDTVHMYTTISHEHQQMCSNLLQQRKTTEEDHQKELNDQQLEYESRINKIETELNQLKESDSKHEQIQSELQSTIDDKNAEIMKLQNIIAVKTEDASKLTSSRNDEIEIKDQQIARIQLESEDLKQQLLDKTQFAAKVNEQLKSLEKALRTQLHDSESSRNEMKIQLDATTKKLATFKDAGKYYQDKSERLKEMNATLEREKSEITAKCKLYKKEISEFNSQMSEEREQHESLKAQNEKLVSELKAVRKETTMSDRNEDIIAKLRDELDKLEIKLASSEMMTNSWRERFEELDRFVTPFRQDLAKYSAEREHLAGENSKKSAELSDLYNQLAQSMGHQNQKQKIKYLAKLKNENQDLREKISSKECELKKAKRQIDALSDDVNALKGIKRFDPKKAFKSVN